jgi:hypothetical protein
MAKLDIRSRTKQSICLVQEDGRHHMYVYDALPPWVRRRLRASPYNLCASCVCGGYDYMATIERMEAQVVEMNEQLDRAAELAAEHRRIQQTILKQDDITRWLWQARDRLSSRLTATAVTPVKAKATRPVRRLKPRPKPKGKPKRKRTK